jgi:hypothetical protein
MAIPFKFAAMPATAACRHRDDPRAGLLLWARIPTADPPHNFCSRDTARTLWRPHLSALSVPRMSRGAERITIIEQGRTGEWNHQCRRRQDKSAGADRRIGVAKSLSAHRVGWRQRRCAGARIEAIGLLRLRFSGARRSFGGRSVRTAP